MPTLSPRLAEIVDALPLRPGMRVIEFGCGPGAAAREVADRVGPSGHVLAVDRSATAIGQVRRQAARLIEEGRLSVRVAEVETFVLDADDEPYDLAFAVRVGLLDGRHPARRDEALARIAASLVPGGRLLVDGGDPLVDVPLREA